MDISNEASKVSEYLKTGASTLLKESQKILEISRLNLEIYSIDKEINLLYLRLGKIIYEEYSHDNKASKKIDKYCIKISALKEDISKAEKNISIAESA